ncbi:hypothetical protein VKT23_015572 [Stygiomarasmius scandens]|uniref:C2H2-type domain-containing protein n=1 Tax=Marasmiellus scandens TaxID=2682957 RepID=A0ABR1IZN8_9AGAR
MYGGSMCSRCANLKPDIDEVKNRAARSYLEGRSTDPLHERSHAQLLETCSHLRDNFNKEKLDHLNTKNKLQTANGIINEYQTLVTTIGTKVVPALHRIFVAAVNQDWSLKNLVRKIDQAIENRYHCRDFAQWEIDLAILMYEYGGHSATYALHHSPFALPCLNTLQKHRRHFTLTPCVNGIQVVDVYQNMEALFRPRIGQSDPVPRRVGITLAFDELATEQHIDYVPETDQLAGFCLEHSSDVQSLFVGRDTTTVDAAMKLTKEGKLHVASETCVGAIFRHDEKDYKACPIYLGATCKTGGIGGAIRMIQKVSGAYQLSPHGASKYGDIWTISSDGCPTRRPALYLLCMIRELRPSDTLYKFLGKLPGLNLYTGLKFVTNDFDFKHVLFKSKYLSYKKSYAVSHDFDLGPCTALCSPDGILVNGERIDKNVLSIWLEYLDDHDWFDHTIYALLNPYDPQDVPRALKLLSLITDLRDLDTSQFTPSEMSVHRAICLLSELFEAFLEPFINPILSLSKQLHYLSKLAHITCALFLQNGTSFISNQLYGDIQALVKNAFFVVAKTVDLDPTLKVFICLLGDDPLEALFGIIRMIGGHSPNCSLMDLRYRMRSAVNVNDICHRHPVWQQTPRRLKLSRLRDYDHLRPGHWEGDIIAGHCNITDCWISGRDAATDVLQKYGVKMQTTFQELFAKDGFDLMRPYGGKYVAVSNEVNSDINLLVDQLRDGKSDSLPLQSVEGMTTSDILSFNAEKVMEEENAKMTRTQGAHSLFMDIDGKSCHKRTLIRVSFDPYGDVANGKSHDRNLRVQQTRTFTSNAREHWDRKKNPNEFGLYDIFATFIRLDETNVSLAILKCLGITNNSTSNSTKLCSVPKAELAASSSHYTISGQILSLFPYQDEDGTYQWVWNGEFVHFRPYKVKKNTSKNTSTPPLPLDVTRKSNIVLPVDGHQVLAIGNLAEQVDVESCNEYIQTRMSFETGPTWFIPDEYMQFLWTETLALYHKFKIMDSKIQIREIVPLPTRFSYPYLRKPNTDISDSGICYSSTISNAHILKSAVSDGKRECRVCKKIVDASDIQNHVGKHILFSLRGVVDKSVQNPINIGHYPCGTCGRATIDVTNPCTISTKGGKAQSSCPAAYAFVITSVLKRTNKSTNAPVSCPVSECQQMHWKYNLPKHLTDHHQVDLHNKAFFDKIGAVGTSNIQITQREQISLGISIDDVEILGPVVHNQPTTPSRQRTGDKRPPQSPAGTPSSRHYGKKRAVEKIVQ